MLPRRNRVDKDWRKILNSPWLNWRVVEGNELLVEAGWSNFLCVDQGLVEDRLVRILSDRIGTDDRQIEKRTVKEVAPRDVRSLIILVDHISRLPWSRLEKRVEPGDWRRLLLILNLLCLDAYRGAFNECLRIEAEMLAGSEAKSPEWGFEKVESLDSKQIFEHTEDDLESLIQVMSEEWNKLKNGVDSAHPMRVAVHKFLQEVVAEGVEREKKASGTE